MFPPQYFELKYLWVNINLPTVHNVNCLFTAVCLPQTPQTTDYYSESNYNLKKQTAERIVVLK